MTGLRPWKRDRELPAQAGEPELTPPTEGHLLELIGEHLLPPGTEAPIAARWVYARWKPGASLCSAYALDFDDGTEQLVVLKRYRGDKAAALAARSEPPPRGDDTEYRRLLPSAVVPEERLHLWCEGHDRELPGQLRLADMRRTKRLLAAQGVFAPMRLRSHRSRLVRLRYRPERRAVYRLDAWLRDESGTRREDRLAVRALPPATASLVAARRTAHGGGDFLPRLLAAELRSGLLFEEWLDVESCADDDFQHVGAAAGLLARLHRPAPALEGWVLAEPSSSDPLFSWNTELAQEVGEENAPLPDGPSYWTHGDFHPDQVAFTRHGKKPRLLDLDGLAAGDHHADLASWIADVMIAQAQGVPQLAGEELLADYAAAGGPTVDPARLARHVSAALKCRAAASLRRLEENAVSKARELLELARWADDGAVTRPR